VHGGDCLQNKGADGDLLEVLQFHFLLHFEYECEDE
jgi:hypothetical protein